MKQSCVLIFTLVCGLEIEGGFCENKLMDFVNKSIGQTSSQSTDTNLAVLNFALSLLDNDQDSTPARDANRFFYTGIDWTLNLIPTIILIKVAFIGGFNIICFAEII